MAAVPSIGRAANVEPGAGDGSIALASLYERHSHRVFRYCLAYLRKRDEAEDAAQTTFLYALRALRRGVVPTSESAWLLKIARNVCLARFDSVKRRGNLELIQDPHVLAETASARPGGDMDLIGLQAALERLPQRQRQAILLREWQGLSYAEIAEELGLTTSAVETLLFRARRSLARELGGEESRRGLDLAGLLGWAKALLGGGAAQVAVGAAVVATIGIAAPLAVHRSHDGAPPAKQPVAVPSEQQTPHTAPVSAAVTPNQAHRHTRSALRSAPAAARKVSNPAPAPAQAAPAPSAAPAPDGNVGPSAPTAGSDAPSSAPAASTAVPVATPALPDATAALSDTTAALPVPAPSLPDPAQTVPVPVPSVPDAPSLPAVPTLPPPPPTPDPSALPNLP